MNDPAQSSTDTGGVPPAASTPPPTPSDPTSKSRRRFRLRNITMFKDLPYIWKYAPPSYPLIQEPLDELLKGVDKSLADQVREDMQMLQPRLFKYFTELDRDALIAQNQYRRTQVGYIILAALATLLGALQGLAYSGDSNDLLAIFAFSETVVALLAVLLAQVGHSREALDTWITKRRSAEGLRREFFRFLMYLDPYDYKDEVERYELLNQRVSDLYGGQLADDPTQPPGATS